MPLWVILSTTTETLLGRVDRQGCSLMTSRGSDCMFILVSLYISAYVRVTVTYKTEFLQF